MNRGERRERTYKKWISRLKKCWNSNTFFNRIWEVKTNRQSYFDEPIAESFADFKKDRFGVMIKNTGTMFTDNKLLTIREERKRNLKNREIPKEDLEEYYNADN